MLYPTVTKKERDRIEELVAHFRENARWFSLVLEQVRGVIEASAQLREHIHSMKWRVKDPAHLKDKLLRKLEAQKIKKKSLDIKNETLFTKVNDLAGLRILHLYTQQMQYINPLLKNSIAEAKFKLVEGPIARVWDDESRNFFKGIGIPTIPSERMYTSVHYVVQTNMRTPYTCEIQVRTLMEEVWGEVDHTINYPHKTDDVACREQIAALARVTSGCSRLVDSIFRSHAAAIQGAARRRKGKFKQLGK